MKPFLVKYYVAFNGMPMQECDSHRAAVVYRDGIIARQNELDASVEFNEDALTIVKLQMFQLSNH